MNIKLSYLYRDYANYKKFNEIIFHNPDALPVDLIESVIREHLIDGEWFYASEWKLPDLHFDSWDPEDDHFFHEFESVEETTEPPTSSISIEAFLEVVRKAKTSIYR